MKAKNLAYYLAIAAMVASPLLAETIAVNFGYTLQGIKCGTSTSGYNTIALPFVRATGLEKASDLMGDIEDAMSSGSVTSVSRCERDTGGSATYAGSLEANNFDLEDVWAGYLIKVNYNDVDDNAFEYTITGHHDSSQRVVQTVKNSAPPSSSSRTGSASSKAQTWTRR